MTKGSQTAISAFMIDTSMNQILVAWFCICVGLYARRLVHSLYFCTLKNVPGPFLTRVTRLGKLFITATGCEHEWYVRLHEQYGPVVRVAPNHFSFNRWEDIDTIYNGNLEKSEFYDAFGDPRCPNPWSVRDNRQHEIRKRGFAHMYSMSSTKDHEKAVDRNVELLKDKLAEHARTGSLCSIPYLLKFCVFDMMSSITFGKDFEALECLDDETGVIGLIESAFWCSALLGDLPRLCRGLVWAGRWLGLKPPILCLLKRVLHLRPGRSAADELSDSFLRRLFILLDEDGTNRQVIEDCCFSNIAIGIGKMSIALSAAIYHIYQRPEVLRKLRQELDNMTDVGTLPNSARLEEVLDLPYLQAVIQETLRVHPAIGTMLPRIVPRGGLKIAEYVFPEGTVVGVNPWAANRNAEDYGEDVDEFCPERWLKEGNFQPGSLFSFGAGSRVCIGNNICQMVMSILIAELVREFDIDLSSDTAFPNTKTGWFSWIDFEGFVQRRNKARSDFI